MRKEIVTDIDTLGKIIESKNGHKLTKVLVWMLFLNIGTVVSGTWYTSQKFYEFQNTMAQVKEMKVVQEFHSVQIEGLRINDADFGARLKNVEKTK
jgi:hypothetical protein